jgi:hypothetical protein
MRASSCRQSLAFLAGLALFGGAPPGLADSGTEWGKRALDIQNQIDHAAPFTDTTWVGTHNSFNAYEWDPAYKVDPNQKNRPKEQMSHGARELTFDVYWSQEGLNEGRFLMCHGTCSLGEKQFRDGLDEIRDWLNDGRPDAVILLKIEVNKSMLDDKFSKFANQLEGSIGGKIYKPSHHGVADGCAGLNPAKITKQQVLDAGKNVIVISTSEHGCPKNGKFNEWIFSGFHFNDGSKAKKFERPKSVSACRSFEEQHGDQRMMRLHDGATWRSIGDGDDGMELRPDRVDPYLECGLNVLELFNYNGQGADTSRPWLKPQDLVWSWRQGQPDNAQGKEHCAVNHRDGDFTDDPCDAVHPFACRTATGGWKVSTKEGRFDEGESVCKEEFGADAEFAAPVNSRQNQTLVTAKKLAGKHDAWIDYQDRSMEGHWVANAATTRGGATKVEARGGSDGDSFDDKGELALDLYRSTPRSLRKVTLRADKHLDRVVLEYSDGRTVSHGGNDGKDKTLTLDNGERIEGYEICVDKKKKKGDRVYYLSLRTSKNRRVSAGKKKGDCTSERFEGKHLFGFHGRASGNVYSLGFYFRDN